MEPTLSWVSGHLGNIAKASDHVGLALGSGTSCISFAGRPPSPTREMQCFTQSSPHNLTVGTRNHTPPVQVDAWHMADAEMGVTINMPLVGDPS